MTSLDRLTINHCTLEEVEAYLGAIDADGDNLLPVRIARQLVVTMRENEQLRNLVEAFHHETMYKDNPGLHDLAIAILQPNKHPVVCKEHVMSGIYNADGERIGSASEECDFQTRD